jgi:hypothetical protein
MKIFISWSGKKSHKSAILLKEWIPLVIQEAEVYVSSEDIDKGARWSMDISKELNDSTYGIVCVTKDNQNAPWINFEAGALGKLIDISRVTPFLLDLKRAELDPGPLLQFQSTIFEKEDVLKLFKSINKVCVKTIEETRLQSTFDVWWEKYNQNMLKIIQEETKDEKTGVRNKQIQYLEEILQLTRQNQKEFSQLQEQILVKTLKIGTETIEISDLKELFLTQCQIIRSYNDFHSSPEDLNLLIPLFNNIYRLPNLMTPLSSILRIRIPRMRDPSTINQDE